MTEPAVLMERLQTLLRTAVEMYRHDGEHGTVLFPMLNGQISAVLGVPEWQLNDYEIAEIQSAQVRLTALSSAADAFILITEGWVTVTALQNGGKQSDVPTGRSHSLTLSAASNDGFRQIVTAVFDDSRKVLGYLDPKTSKQTNIERALDAISGPLFDADATHWRDLLDERLPGWDRPAGAMPIVQTD